MVFQGTVLQKKMKEEKTTISIPDKNTIKEEGTEITRVNNIVDRIKMEKENSNTDNKPEKVVKTKDCEYLATGCSFMLELIIDHIYYISSLKFSTTVITGLEITMQRSYICNEEILNNALSKCIVIVHDLVCFSLYGYLYSVD